MKISIHINDLDVAADNQTLVQLLALLTGNKEVQPSVQITENTPAETLPPEKEALEVEAEVRPEKKQELLIANAYAKPMKDGQPLQVLLIPFGRFSVKSWKEVLVETAELLIAKDLLPFQTVPFGDSQIPLVTTSKRSKRPLVQLTNGLYLDAGHSAKDIIRRAVALVEACGLSDKAFAVYYKKWSRHA
jgi:hypothetical protein